YGRPLCASANAGTSLTRPRGRGAGVLPADRAAAGPSFAASRCPVRRPERGRRPRFGNFGRSLEKPVALRSDLPAFHLALFHFAPSPSARPPPRSLPANLARLAAVA